jgi:hypothetical protein
MQQLHGNATARPGSRAKARSTQHMIETARAAEAEAAAAESDKHAMQRNACATRGHSSAQQRARHPNTSGKWSGCCSDPHAVPLQSCRGPLRPPTAGWRCRGCGRPSGAAGTLEQHAVNSHGRLLQHCSRVNMAHKSRHCGLARLLPSHFHLPSIAHHMQHLPVKSCSIHKHAQHQQIQEADATIKTQPNTALSQIQR